MTCLSLRTIHPRCIQIIARNEYYKLKYTGDITVLSLIIYSPLTRITHYDGKVKFTIRDKTTIQSLLEIDRILSRDIPPYKPILIKGDGEYFIQLYQNPKLLDICERMPKSIHIHVKSVRRNTHLNTPIIYIIG